MKRASAAILFFIGSFANAAIYNCTSQLGSKQSGSWHVNTSTNLQYIWIFKEYPDVELWCGTGRGSDKLKCSIEKNGTGVHAVILNSEVAIGDSHLFTESPTCAENNGCSISCSLVKN